MLNSSKDEGDDKKEGAAKGKEEMDVVAAAKKREVDGKRIAMVMCEAVEVITFKR